MAEYIYKAKDSDLKGFAANFMNRVGDSSGPHDMDYFDMIKLLLSIKRNGSLLDIGSGVGRIPLFSRDMIARTVALEPDRERWKKCYDAYHQPPRCEVNCLMTSEYIEQNPGVTFDVIVIGMVVQHMSTSACQQLFAEAAQLLKDDGVCIIATSLALEETRGFSYSQAEGDDVYISEEAFNRYANDPANQDRGIPVRRFSQAELLDCLKPYLDVVYWRQFSYYRPERLEFYGNRLRVEKEKLRDVGFSQFVVTQRPFPGEG